MYDCGIGTEILISHAFCCEPSPQECTCMSACSSSILKEMKSSSDVNESARSGSTRGGQTGVGKSSLYSGYGIIGNPPSPACTFKRAATWPIQQCSAVAHSQSQLATCACRPACRPLPRESGQRGRGSSAGAVASSGLFCSPGANHAGLSILIICCRPQGNKRF